MGAVESLFRVSRSRPVSFVGTRSYIDSLNTRRALALKFGLLGNRRNLSMITTVSTRPLGRINRSVHVPVFINNSLADGRFWHPLGKSRPLAATQADAGDVVASRLDPDRSFDDDERVIRKIERKALRSLDPNHNVFGNSLSFKRPSRLLLCLRRSIRRNVLHAFGVAGKVGLRIPRYNEYSRIRC